MDWITLLGLTAAVGTTIAFLPQVIKIVKTKHTKDLSSVMYIILTTGLFLWLVYGILIKNLPLIMANSITFIFSLIILIFKIKYK